MWDKDESLDQYVRVTIIGDQRSLELCLILNSQQVLATWKTLIAATSPTFRAYVFRTQIVQLFCLFFIYFIFILSVYFLYM